ncbi:hypothetical protein C1893_17560 [Pseudomonas sp. MPR-ANC1]|nr:hypothetical protein C1893_17560 [Pseudomonas sp. MPR-ANC1]
MATGNAGELAQHGQFLGQRGFKLYEQLNLSSRDKREQARFFIDANLHVGGKGLLFEEPGERWACDHFLQGSACRITHFIESTACHSRYKPVFQF